MLYRKSRNFGLVWRLRDNFELVFTLVLNKNMTDSFPFEKAVDITAALSKLDKLKHGYFGKFNWTVLFF